MTELILANEGLLKSIFWDLSIGIRIDSICHTILTLWGVFSKAGVGKIFIIYSKIGNHSVAFETKFII